MYMMLAGGILRYELLVWMRNSCTENHLDLDSVKNKNKMYQLIKKDKVNKDYLLLFLFSFKTIRIFKNPISQNSLKVLALLVGNLSRFFTQHLWSISASNIRSL